LCESLKNGESNFAVMAIENSIAGSILPNYFLLQEYHFSIIGEVYLPIHMHLLALPGVKLSDIKNIESHPMAIRQCSDYLHRLNGVEIREGELSKIISGIPRIDWLTEERFSFLKKEVGELARSIPSDAILRETLEFLLSGDRQAAAFLLARVTKLDLRASIDLSMGIESKLKEVVQRGMKNMKSSGP